MEIQKVEHYQINGRFEVQIERSAVKGVDGFKVTAHGDDIVKVLDDVHFLQDHAERMTAPKPAPAIEAKEK
jgi:hypothetical protein